MSCGPQRATPMQYDWYMSTAVNKMGLNFTSGNSFCWMLYYIYYPPIHVLVSPMASFPHASPPTPCAYLCPPPYAPHALPTSFVSILPPTQYWVRSTDHSAPPSFLNSPVTSSLLGIYIALREKYIFCRFYDSLLFLSSSYKLAYATCVL
jgi:hypothetical protein